MRKFPPPREKKYPKFTYLDILCERVSNYAKSFCSDFDRSSGLSPVGALSVAHVKRALDTVEEENSDHWEDRLNRTGQVAERLADQLACAEYSIRRRFGWEKYRRLVGEFMG